MDCPACKKRSLKATRIAHGLPGYTCSSCQGCLIDILSYRMWLEGRPPGNTSQADLPECVEDSSKAVMCPKCAKIMMKFNISGDVNNRLDLCSYCGEVWLDGGEWQLLEQLNLTDKLPQIFSDPWQKQIRKGKIEQGIEQKYESILGQEVYQKVKQFREWLLEQKRSSEILDYLNRPKSE